MLYHSNSCVVKASIDIMKFPVVLALTVCAVAADRLDNIYLPPVSAKTADGGGLLAPPAFNTRVASSYVPPASGPVPSQVYNAPSARTHSGLIGGAPVAILRFNNDNVGDGTYRFEYETENRISQQESGNLKNAGTDHEANVVQGSYSYTGPDGVTYTVNYVADENGFRASGDHLPTPPPVPAEIQRSLEINAVSSRSGYSDTDSFTTSKDPSRQYLTPHVSQRAGGYNY